MLRDLCGNFRRCFSQRSQSQCPELWLCTAQPGGLGNTRMVLEEILSFFPFLSFAAFPNFMPSSIPKTWFSRILPDFHRFDPQMCSQAPPSHYLEFLSLSLLSPHGFEISPFCPHYPTWIKNPKFFQGKLCREAPVTAGRENF